MFGSFANVHVVLAGLTYTRLFSPTMINELRAAFSRTNNQTKGAFSGTDYTSQFGLPVSSTDPGPIGFPQIYSTGYQQIGPSNGTWAEVNSPSSTSSFRRIFRW